ncbi:hypothetical protein PPERSA_08959 [Pseudocohnilembus persalinus]|uniref:Uncharacterized protein n=1 Tax=Pseudocohnilembus persalinus TaxID=266149 RepID=A0A0V0R2Y5_PSEPJ|nr:hypothetical protein PPERSA_08959 [Pseudocohnilembus persalinus]|eukprot:KRX08855.1 hypothetical protein PPERSA_08959 [Pseudocohnilembus persalinus]
MTKLELKFKLTEALTKTDFLEIAFPFSLHYLSTASPYTDSAQGLQIPLNLKANWFFIDENTGKYLDASQNNWCRLFVNDLSSSVYYLQFLNDQLEVIPIDSVWYSIYFTINDIRAQDLQYDSEVLIIQMRSVSSPDPDYSIIYQENQVLSYFYLYNDPSSNMDFSVAYQNQANQGNINSQNIVYFDAYFSSLDESYFDDYVRIYIKILDTNFQFVDGSSCYSSTKYTYPTINSYTSSQYTCSILEKDTSTLQILIEKNAFLTQKAVRIAGKVQNPKKIISGADVEIRLLKQISPQILALQTVQNALYTTALKLSYHELFFAWGLREDPNLPVHLKIVRQDSKNSAYQPYNSLKSLFKLQEFSPPNVELKVNLKINVDSDAQLLPGHVTHNLPAAPGKAVVCSEINKYSVQKREISCKGVGQMEPDYPYFIAFKMTFPYDVLYESISTESLGAITISTGLGLNSEDSLYVFGRQSDFLQHLQSLDDTFLIREDSVDFVNYLKKFSQIQILARAQDFQDYENEIIMCKRPHDYTNTNDNNSQKKQYFDDLFMPADVNDFLEYVVQFQKGFYIFQRDIQDHMDYIKDYDDEYLIKLSIPTNMDEIETINGKNFQPNFNSYQPTIISSVPVYEEFSDPFDSATPSQQLGLQKLNDISQRLVFALNYGYTDLTKSGTLISNTDFQDFFQVGINIMTNYKIKPVDENYSDVLQTILSQHRSIDTEITHVSQDEEYNKYTNICLTVKNSDALFGLFPNSLNQTYNYFGVQAFRITEFSSQFVNENIYDFYIQMEDGIQGGDTNENIISYALINAYTIDLDAFSNIHVSIANYWNQETEAINGKYIPMLLKITGQLSEDPAQIQKINIFFDNFDLFYSNKFGNEIYCASDINNQVKQQKCMGYSDNAQQETVQLQSFLNWNYITFELTDPTKKFSVIFPIKAFPSDLTTNTINIQIATTRSDTLNDDNFGRINQAGKKFIFDTLSKSSFIPSPTNPTILLNEKGIDTNSLNIGLDVSTLTGGTSYIGEIISTASTPSELNINYLYPTTISDQEIQQNDYLDSNYLTGAGLTYVLDYEFYSSDGTTVTAELYSTTILSIEADNPCLFFHYIYDSYEVDILNYVIEKRYGVFCPNDQQTLPTYSTPLKITNIKMPTDSGLRLNGYLGYSQNDGNLYYLFRQSNDMVDTLQITDISTYDMKPGVFFTIFVLKFEIPFDIQDSLYINISPQTSFPFTNSVDINECKLFKYSTLTWTDPSYEVENDSLYHSCTVNFDSTTTYIQYSIEYLRGKYQAGQVLELYHYGVHTPTSVTSSNLDVKFGKYGTFNPQDYSFTASTVPLQQDSASLTSQLIISNYLQDNLYKGSKTSIQFQLELVSRLFWKGENIYLDLGDFQSSNGDIKDQLFCYILEQDGTLSHNYGTLNIQSLQDIYIQAKTYIFTNSLILIFKCDFIKTPQTNTDPIEVNVRPTKTGISSVFASNTQLTLPTFQDIAVAYSNQNYVEKQFVFPSSNFDLYFYFTPGFNLNSESYIIIIFPIYYLPELSRNQVIECYLLSNENSGERIDLECSIIDNRSVQLKYFLEDLPAAKQFVFIISGITQPIIQDMQYDFYYLVYDSQLQNFYQMDYISDLIDDRAQQIALYSLELNSFNSSSTYLMDDGVNMDWYFTIPENSYDINIGQKLILNFPQFFQYYLRQQESQICKVYDTENGIVNYAGTCKVKALKLIITIKEALEMGKKYRIRLNDMRNNDETNVQLSLWYLEVSDEDSQTIIQKSFPQTSNQLISHYTQSQSSKVLQLQDENGNQITQLNLIKGIFSDWIYLIKDPSEVSFGQSFNLKSYNSDINTYPSDLQVEVGTDHFKFRISSLSALGDYSFLLKKTGGGDYYSNLQSITLYFDDNNRQNFEFYQQNFYVDLNASSFSILLHLKSNPPSSPLTIKFTNSALTSNYGLVFKNQKDTITLSVQKPYDYLYFEVDQSVIFQASSSIPLTMTMTGLNVDSYIPYSVPQIYIIPQDQSSMSNSAPIITQNSLATDKTYNNAEFDITCQKNGRFYYSLTILFQDDTSQCKRTQKQILQKHEDDSTIFESDSDLYPCEDIYGFENVISSTPITIYLEDLKSKKNYRLTGFCQDPEEKNSDTTEVTFQTAFNNGYHAKLIFDFYAQEPTVTQIESLCCLLAINFQTAIQSISTLDGITCDQQFSDTGYDYSQDQFAVSLGLGEINGLDCSEQLIYLEDTENVVSYTKTIYLGRDEYIGDNQIYLDVETQSNCKYFKDYLQDNISTIPLLLNVHPAEVIYDSAPNLINTDEIILYTSYTWAHLNNIQISENGIIYIILVNGNSDTPTVTQLRNLVDSNSNDPLQSEQYLYNKEEVLQYNVTFSDLKASANYDIYFVISNELPFDFATFTDIYKYSFSTRFFSQIYANMQIFSCTVLLTAIFILNL